METNIKLYSKDNWNVRTSTNGNEPLFCLVDIARCLGYSAPSKAVSTHCKKGTKSLFVETKNQYGASVLTSVKFGNLGCVNKLIMKSNAPKAEQFQDWVCDEVLPSIMFTGRYEDTTDYEEEPEKFNPFQFVRDVVGGNSSAGKVQSDNDNQSDIACLARHMTDFVRATTLVHQDLAKKTLELETRIEALESNTRTAPSKPVVKKADKEKTVRIVDGRMLGKGPTYNLLIQPCRAWLSPIVQLLGRYNQVIQVVDRGDEINSDIIVIGFSEEAREAVASQFNNRRYINLKVFKA